MNNGNLTMKVLDKLDELTVDVKALRSDTSDNKQNIDLLSLQMGLNTKAIKAMQTDLGDLKTDVRILKTDVAELKTDVTGLKTSVANLETDVAGLKTDVAELKNDVVEIKADIAELKTDVAELKTDVSDLKTDVAELKTSVYRLEVLHEETDSKIDSILETVAPDFVQIIGLRKHNEIQDEKLQFHERRIGFLEKKVA